MILFLDTSALVKLHVEKPHSAAVRKRVDAAEVVAACRVAYPEAVSALIRRMRAGDLSKSAYGVASRAFRRDWDRLGRVPFLLFYLFCGAVAGAVHVMRTPQNENRGDRKVPRGMEDEPV